MNKPAEKYQDADDARNVAILRERLTAEVEGLRESLAVWTGFKIVRWAR